MAAAATPYVVWLHHTAAQAEHTAAQAEAAAAAYEFAFAMTVPPPAVAAATDTLLPCNAIPFKLSWHAGPAGSVTTAACGGFVAREADQRSEVDR
jgi:hypothetical protein